MIDEEVILSIIKSKGYAKLIDMGTAKQLK
jgi:hypothetical protein